ncbi:MAG: hypothetical protein ACR5KV_04905 [Wolbachia sp.]
MDERVTLEEFIKSFDVIELCKKEYCTDTLITPSDRKNSELLDRFKLKIPLGDNLSSCQRDYATLKNFKLIKVKERSQCDSLCSKSYQQKEKYLDLNELYKSISKVKLNYCKQTCNKNEETIKAQLKNTIKIKKKK